MTMMMATLLGFLLVSLVVNVCVESTSVGAAAPTLDVDQLELDAEKIFDLSKEFKFEDFKESCEIEYADPKEEEKHKKIFMDNVLKAHVSKLAYAHNLIDYFLTINQFTDLTDEQLEGLGKVPFDKQHQQVDISVSVPRRAKAERSLAALMEDETDINARERKSETKQSFGLGRTMRNLGKIIKHKVGDGAEAFVRLMNAMHIEQSKDYEWVAKAIARKYKRDRRPELPDEVFVDHRESGCIVVPQSQSSCSSCYVFATLAYYEWLYCVQTREVVKFSEQYVVDCSEDSKDKAAGCDGGYPQSVASFVGRHGFNLFENYRYTMTELVCIPSLLQRKGLDARRLAYIKLDKPELREITYDKFDKYLPQTPIIVNIYTDKRLKQYGGGVYSEDCQPDKRRGGHVALLIGSGRENGREYWLMKNSWGRHWGEDGFLKLDKNSDCFGCHRVGYILKTFTEKSVSYNFTKSPDYDKDLIPNLLANQNFMRLLS